MDAPLVLTKLRVPAVPMPLVPRTRLTDLLSGAIALGHRATLITAPAGYGKTTLACQWAAQASHHHLVAWVSLDESDDDAVRFTKCLAAAYAVENGARDEHALSRLINALAEHDRSVVMILDDYHAITSNDVHCVVQTLLERLPDNVHLILISRMPPALAFGRLRAAGRLTEMTAVHMGFTPDEAIALFNDVMALDLPHSLVRMLHTRAEGWAAGLKLAGLAVKQGSKPADFGGTHPFVRDYLREEVFLRLPEPTRAFLLRTCGLDVMQPLFCDALTGRDDSASLLGQLVRDNLFLHVDDGGYRRHPMFGEYLRHERARLAAGPDTPSAGAGAVERADPDALSGREVEVMRLIGDGLSNGDIASRLCISPGTVKRHVHNIFSKLDVRTRAEAMARAHALVG